MKWMRDTTLVTALAAISLAGITPTAHAADYSSGVEASLQGGFQVLNKNDTALPDRFVNIPVVYTLGYRLTPVVALEGEFTWMIPLQQSIELAPGARRSH